MKIKIIFFFIHITYTLISQCNDVSSFKYAGMNQISIASRIFDANKLATSSVSLGLTFRDTTFYLFSAIDAFSISGANKSAHLRFEFILKNGIKITKFSNRFQNARVDFMSNLEQIGSSLENVANVLSLFTGGSTSNSSKIYYIVNYFPLTLSEVEQISKSGINDLSLYYDQEFAKSKDFKIKSDFHEKSSIAARCMLDAFHNHDKIRKSKYVLAKSPSFTEDMNLSEVSDSVINKVNHFLKGKYVVNRDIYFEFMLGSKGKPYNFYVFNLTLDKKEYKTITKLIKAIDFNLIPATGIHGKKIDLFFNSFNGFDELYSIYDKEFSSKK